MYYVREDGGDVHASGALNIHEKAVGGGHKALELVLAGLAGLRGVQQIFFELQAWKRLRQRKDAMMDVSDVVGRG